MEESKIIILRGNSGSGKTTVARQLQRKLGRGTLLISQDAVRREMLFVRDEPGNMAITLLINLIEYGRKNCKCVILEGILYSNYYQRLFDSIISEYNSNIYAYYFDIPFEETLIRHKTKPNSNEFGEEEMKRWWRDSDFIQSIHEEVISRDMKADTIVNLITKQINE